MTKIVYIAGWGRSGSTILDNLLGQVDGFVSTGELHNLWDRGILRNRSCGCGTPLSRCPFWRDVFVAAFGGIGRVDVRSVMAAQRRIHTRHAVAALRSMRAGTVLENYEYASHLHNLYGGIEQTSGASVIVDSSKFPTDAIVAAGLPGHEVYVVHLVRDPRAVAYSWRRRKRAPDKNTNQGLLTRVGMVRSTAVWVCYNAVISVLTKSAVGSSRYLLLNYEDLASDPDSALRRVMALLGEAARPGPTVTRDGWTSLRATHTASGNPGRFQSGATRIKLDDEWRRLMSPAQILAVSTLALPQLRATGYQWRVRGE